MFEKCRAGCARRLPIVFLAICTNLIQADVPQVIKNSIGMQLTPIPAGSFMMGSPRSEDERDDKEERHEVTITKPFYLGVYEVKQREYNAVMNGVATNRSAFKDADNPVENVEWKFAKQFCERLSSRSAEKPPFRTATVAFIGDLPRCAARGCRRSGSPTGVRCRSPPAPAGARPRQAVPGPRRWRCRC